MNSEAGVRESSIKTDPLSPLKSRGQWVCWKYFPNANRHKDDKVPVDPRTLFKLSWSKEGSWLTYSEAREVCDRSPGIDGIGFIPTADDPYALLDFDDVIDPYTGEVDPVVDRIIQLCASYAEVSPSRTGIRVVVMGRLNETGDKYRYQDTTLEAYDQRHFLTITGDVYLDRPIREAQWFLEKLERLTTDKGTGAEDLPEIELPDDLVETAEKVRTLLIKNDIDPQPMIEGSRKISLISCGAKVWQRERMSEEEFWEFLNQINATFMYNKNGELEGLSLKDLVEVYNTNTNIHRPTASPDVLDLIDDLLQYLILIRIGTKRTKSTDWEVVYSLLKHGRKYGSMWADQLKVECSWGTLKDISRIGSDQTLHDSRKRLDKNMGITFTPNTEDRNKSGYFLIDPEALMDPGSWDQEAESIRYLLYLLHQKAREEETGTTSHQNYFQIEQGELEEHYDHHCSTVTHNLSSPVFDLRAMDSIVSTSWHRGVGQTYLNYLLAIVVLSGKARSKDIAAATGRRQTSISGAMTKLIDLGLVENVGWGKYRLAGDLPWKIFKSRREASEFVRDYAAKTQTQRKRLKRDYHLELSRAATVGQDLEQVTVPRGITTEDKEKIQRQVQVRTRG